MPRELVLSGGEIRIIKALGTGGTPLSGKLLLDRLGETDETELLDTLDTLISMDYIVSSKVNVTKIEDVERAIFRVNSTYSRDLKEALQPGRKEDDRSRRRRRG